MKDFNLICASCACLGVDCSGTADPVWTGCVYRKPDHRMQITLVKPQSASYTPAKLMRQWSKENNVRFYRTKHGSARLCCNGAVWEYDYWEINKQDNGTEHVTVHLVKSQTD